MVIHSPHASIILLITFLYLSLVHAVVHKVAAHSIDGICATHDLVVLNFCTSWSIQCKEIAPEYERASNATYPIGKVFFGTVDAKAESRLRNQYNVWSYPHIVVRRADGSTVQYRGRVHSLGIVSFVKRAAFTGLQPMVAPAHIDEFLHFEDVAVLGIFEDDKREYHNYLEITKRLQSRILIGFTTNRTYLQSMYGIEPSPATVVVYKRFESSMVVYKSEFSIKVLANWILESTKLLVNFLHPENAFKYLGFKVPGVLLFLDTLNSNVTVLGQTTFQHAISSGNHIAVTTIHSTSIPSPSTSPSPPPNTNPTSATDSHVHVDMNVMSATHEHNLRDAEPRHSTDTSHPPENVADGQTTTTTPPTTTPPTTTTTTATSTTSTIYTMSNDFDFGITRNIAEHNVALRSELPNRECTGEFLTCLAMFHELAPAYKGKLNFIYTDGLSYEPFMNRLGLHKLPSVVILDWSQEKHYLFDPAEPLTPATLHTLFADFFSNKLLHFVRSAPLSPPPSPHPSLVLSEGNTTRLVHVVADNFKEKVLNTSKYVVLNIHLPWCGYCKSVWPAYEKLASLVLDDNVIIADFDASTNDMPRDFPATAWPTYFPHITLFHPNANENPVDMVKELSLENMVEFLVENIPGFTPTVNAYVVQDPEEERSYLQQLLRR